jgi:hypothetical protein
VALAWLPATAASQLGPNGDPITTSDYTIDLTRGVVISTSRVVGLSGAATSLAQGVEGGLQNPAAVAYRGPQWPEWYDYWLAFGVTYPFKAGDFYNSGRVLGDTENLKEDTLFLIPGAYFQIWNLGIGLTIDSQFIRLEGVVNPTTMEQESLRLRFTTFHIQAGYGFLNGQLIIGAGLRILRQRAFLSKRVVSDGDAYHTLGLGAEVGVMFRPHHKRWTLGASLFPEIRTGLRTRGNITQTPEGDILIGDFFLPHSTRLPTTGSLDPPIHPGWAKRTWQRPSSDGSTDRKRRPSKKSRRRLPRCGRAADLTSMCACRLSNRSTQGSTPRSSSPAKR